jgi:hypothetical protein
VAPFHHEGDEKSDDGQDADDGVPVEAAHGASAIPADVIRARAGERPYVTPRWLAVVSSMVPRSAPASP